MRTVSALQATIADASRKSRMNLRHAAALALVGWYLMTPPLSWSSDRKVIGSDLSRPLSQWLPGLVFDTEAECNKEIDAMKPKGR